MRSTKRPATPSAPRFRINAFLASENREAYIALRSSQPVTAENLTITVQESGLRAINGKPGPRSEKQNDE
jgi:hypothetical protein